MRTFYTGNDIEDLAARGVLQLETGPGVFLTDAARERAEELGIALIVPGSTPTGKAATQVAPTQSKSLPNRPRGCQHGPSLAQVSHKAATGNGSPMVDQLVNAVSALNKRGG